MTKYWVVIIAALATVGGGLRPADARAEASDSADVLATRFQMVMDFNRGIQNQLGGYYNKFESSPSSASTWLAPDICRGEVGRSLRITGHRAEAGFCGVWVQFFDFKAREPKFFDARPYKFLSFWVRGEKGGEDFLVKLADKNFIQKEDSLALGPVRRFLKDGVTTQWQEVIVPIRMNGRVNIKNLGGLTIEFVNPGHHTIYIDDISFKSDKATPTPISKVGDVLPAATKPMPRAMWIWEVDPLLENASDRRELFDFCKQEHIQQLWVQLPYKLQPAIDLTKPLAEGALPDDVVCVIAKPNKIRRFLRESHANNIDVHVLEGYPEFAQRPYHRFPAAIVEAVIRFNRGSAPNERYDGIHLDNEPYLLVGWHDPKRREQILIEFLELNEMLQKMVRKHSDMVYGIDIPFWWNQLEGGTGRTIGEVTYKGVRKSATFHLIDMLDNIGVMNYRDTADGADGMIIYGRDILDYAEQANKAEVFIGVETFAYDPTQVWLAAGLPHVTFNAILGEPEGKLIFLSRMNGFKVKTFTDTLNVHVGIEVPNNITPDATDRLTHSMVTIAKRFGVPAHTMFEERAQAAVAGALDDLKRDPEWLQPSRKDIIDPDSGTTYPGMVATRIMLPKITFGDNSYDDFQLQTLTAEDFFRQYKCYAGTAIHYYATYRRIVEHDRKMKAARAAGENVPPPDTPVKDHH